MSLLQDPSSGTAANVKPANTAPVASDSAVVVAISPNSPAALTTDNVGSGSLGGLSATVTTTTNGQSSLVANITGTWSGTISFQATTDGTNWFALEGQNLSTFNTSLASSLVTTTTANGTFIFAVGGFKQIRFSMTAYTSGTANIAYDGSIGTNNAGLLSVIAANTGASTTDFTNSGTISALNGAVSVIGQGVYTVTASITGTWSATLVAEGQLADLTWVQIPIYQITGTLPYAAMFSTTSNGTFAITGGGFLNVRIRASLYTSGTANIALDGALSQQTVFAAQLGTWASQINDGTHGPVAVKAASVSPGATDPALVTVKRPQVTYTSVYQLAATTSVALSATLSASAKQYATIYHANTAVKNVRLRKVAVYVEDASVATKLALQLQRLTSTTAPATGNPAITPTAHNPAAAAAESTCLALPTTAGSTGGTGVGLISAVELNLGIGTTGTTVPNPVSPEIVLYDDSQGGDLEPLTIRAGNAEGYAVVLAGSGTNTVVLATVKITFTEE